MKRIKTPGWGLFFTAFYTFLLLPFAPLWAQSLELSSDFDIGARGAPQIDHKLPHTRIEKGKPLALQATITDDIGVSTATVFYRNSDDANYLSLLMKKDGDSYTAKIPKGDIFGPRFEYYIEAVDKAGNTVSQGSALAPLVITVSTPFDLGQPPPEKQVWYKKWWVWGLVALVAGVVAATAGGGGSNDSASPTTGSANISASIP